MDTTVPAPEWKPASELRPRDVLNDPFLADYPVRVEYVADGHRTDTGSMFVVLLDDATMKPTYLDPERMLRVATDDEVAESEAYLRRRRMADRMEKFAETLRVRQLPIGAYPHFRLATNLTREQLIAVGDLLGIKPEREYNNSFTVAWPAGAEYRDFQVDFSSHYTKAEMAAEGLDEKGQPLPVKPTPASVRAVKKATPATSKTNGQEKQA